MQPAVNAFHHKPTGSWTYVVMDPGTRAAAVIDPVLDYDAKAGTVDVRSVRSMLAAAEQAGYSVEWALETHAHADQRRDFMLSELTEGDRLILDYLGTGAQVSLVRRRSL